MTTKAIPLRICQEDIDRARELIPYVTMLQERFREVIGSKKGGRPPTDGRGRPKKTRGFSP